MMMSLRGLHNTLQYRSARPSCMGSSWLEKLNTNNNKNWCDVVSQYQETGAQFPVQKLNSSWMAAQYVGAYFSTYLM